MDFYNIYKIFKDLTRTFFGNKILKILLFLLLFIFIMFIKNECFATVYEFSDGQSYDINDSSINTTDKNFSMFIYDVEYSGGTEQYLIYSLYGDDKMLGLRTSNRSIEILSFIADGQPHYSYSLDYSSTNITTNINNNTAITPNSLSSTTNPMYYTRTANITNIRYYTTQDIYSFTTSGGQYTSTDILYPILPTYISPTLSNTQTQLENLNFSNFIINTNSFTEDMVSNPDEPLVMLFYNRSLSNSSNTDGLYPIKEKYFYKESIYFDKDNSTDTNYIFNYPIFNTGVFFNIGSTYEIRFAKRVYLQEFDSWGYDYFDTNYIFTISTNITQDYINQLNQQTAITTDEDNHKEQLNAINNQTQAIENQTQSIDNINNSITNSTVDSSSIDLPTDNTNDPTQSGVDNIFQTIYNTFTSGNAQDVVFPIPFTNRNITLQANYIYDVLQNNGASWIVTIIQSFYWYIISRFIIVDIMKKIRKIKQGDFENIQNSNIKEDML